MYVLSLLQCTIAMRASAFIEVHLAFASPGTSEPPSEPVPAHLWEIPDISSVMQMN